MRAVIIFYKRFDTPEESIKHLGETDGGIYEGVTYNKAVAALGEHNIIAYIPLRVSGEYYEERKSNLQDLAISWSNNGGEYQAWSYGELAEIQGFFEQAGRRYGLVKEFRENGII